MLSVVLCPHRHAIVVSPLTDGIAINLPGPLSGCHKGDIQFMNKIVGLASKYVSGTQTSSLTTFSNPQSLPAQTNHSSLPMGVRCVHLDTSPPPATQWVSPLQPGWPFQNSKPDQAEFCLFSSGCCFLCLSLPVLPPPVSSVSVEDTPLLLFSPSISPRPWTVLKSLPSCLVQNPTHPCKWILLWWACRVPKAIGWMTAPKDAQVLHSRTCEYVALYGKRDLAGVVKILERGRLSWLFQVGLM